MSVHNFCAVIFLESKYLFDNLELQEKISLTDHSNPIHTFERNDISKNKCSRCITNLERWKQYKRKSYICSIQH